MAISRSVTGLLASGARRSSTALTKSGVGVLLAVPVMTKAPRLRSASSSIASGGTVAAAAVAAGVAVVTDFLRPPPRLMRFLNHALTRDSVRGDVAVAVVVVVAAVAIWEGGVLEMTTGGSTTLELPSVPADTLVLAVTRPLLEGRSEEVASDGCSAEGA